jgi:hypothetical protein
VTSYSNPTRQVLKRLALDHRVDDIVGDRSVVTRRKGSVFDRYLSACKLPPVLLSAIDRDDEWASRAPAGNMSSRIRKQATLPTWLAIPSPAELIWNRRRCFLRLLVGFTC